MEIEINKLITNFESFLLDNGLRFVERQEHKRFGNIRIEYQGDIIGIRIICDRSRWFIDVGAVENVSALKWYDAGILGDYFVGPSEIYSIRQQVDFITEYWQEIIKLLLPEERNNTHNLLLALKKERTARRFPSLQIRKRD